MPQPTPTEITIKGLQEQVKELNEIISGLDSKTSPKLKTELSSDKETELLKIENSKLKYRIKHLLNSLDKKDDEISKLKNQLEKLD
ncbi:15857_t:CDS:2 [Dentiscutata heterogama]|uniref:15857_t:CDS:1 n=1 Tax=Dentiscutata heterogama TaxID=1316150 RepID=A0ACA9LE46_9GLOM|nr:15857_t:CDS:2 [Dentiscutata heterogama]